MLPGACTLCLSINKTNVIINDTNLQPVYEKLVDLKVDSVSCWMCYICRRRLQQCHQLWQLAVHTRPILISSITGFQEDKTDEIFESKNSLVVLSPLHLRNISIPSKDNVGEELEFHVKREPSNDYRTNNRTACRGGDEQSSKEHVFVSNVQIYVQREHEDVKEEYLEDVTEDRSDEETASSSGFPAEDEPAIDIELNDGDSEYDPIAEQNGTAEQTPARSSQTHARTNKRSANSFRCKLCYSVFASRRSLRKHLKNHKEVPQNFYPEPARTYTDNKPFTCDICQRKMSFENLLVHLKTHSNDSLTTCHICQRNCSTKKGLKLHIRFHGNDKPFSCELCEKTFISNANLQVHLRKHTGEKPFSCDVCPRTFPHNFNLQKHLRTHEERAFICDRCGGTFSVKNKLRLHMKTHYK